MPVIAFSSPKGGAGKTTAATILATVLAERGASVAVIDADPNKNVVDWSHLPGKPASLSVTGEVGEETIVDAIEAAAGRAAFVIVDLEGAANLLVSYAIALADFVVIPMQGSQLDAKQAARQMKLIASQDAHIRPLDPLRGPDDARQPCDSAEDAAPYRGPLPRASGARSRDAPLRPRGLPGDLLLRRIGRRPCRQRREQPRRGDRATPTRSPARSSRHCAPASGRPPDVRPSRPAWRPGPVQAGADSADAVARPDPRRLRDGGFPLEGASSLADRPQHAAQSESERRRPGPIRRARRSPARSVRRAARAAARRSRGVGPLPHELVFLADRRKRLGGYPSCRIDGGDLRGLGVFLLQNWLERSRAERDRADRAKIVGYRVSGWLAEVGTRVKLKQDRYDLIRKHNPQMPHPGYVGRQLKFNMVVVIDDVMSDLHYLKKGAGDIAQLDYFIKSHDALLDQAILISDQSISSLPLVEDDIYTGVENHLRIIKQLFEAAQRLLTPILAAANEEER